MLQDPVRIVDAIRSTRAHASARRLWCSGQAARRPAARRRPVSARRRRGGEGRDRRDGSTGVAPRRPLHLHRSRDDRGEQVRPGGAPAGPDDQLDAAERPDGRRCPEVVYADGFGTSGSRWHGRREVVVRRERAALHPRGRDARHDLGRRQGLAPLPRGPDRAGREANAGSARPSPSISARATHSSSRPRSWS